MSKRLQWSWVFLAAGALYGAESARVMDAKSAVNPVLMVVLSAYLFWAVYWGLPAFWRWVSRFAHHASHLRHSRHGLVWLVVTLGATIACGLYFSLLGGGIYEFLKAWRSYRR
jgi:hypothetical protein